MRGSRRTEKEGDGSWTTHKAEKATGICFGSLHGKEGKTGW
jgi:hypothetical protein